MRQAVLLRGPWATADRGRYHPDRFAQEPGKQETLLKIQYRNGIEQKLAKIAKDQPEKENEFNRRQRRGNELCAFPCSSAG